LKIADLRKWDCEKAGFVGEHDRATGAPIPDHISATAKDIEPLMNGLLAANAIMQDPTYDAVLAAAAIAFGIHSSLCRW
jgi:hypothetical protein